MYDKGEIKTKKICIDGLQDHLPTFVRRLKESNDIYDRMVWMYEVNNLNHILSLKNQLKYIKMNKGGFMQSNLMRVSQLKDQSKT